MSGDNPPDTVQPPGPVLPGSSAVIDPSGDNNPQPPVAQSQSSQKEPKDGKDQDQKDPEPSEIGAATFASAIRNAGDLIGAAELISFYEDVRRGGYGISADKIILPDSFVRGMPFASRAVVDFMKKMDHEIVADKPVVNASRASLKPFSLIEEERKQALNLIRESKDRDVYLSLNAVLALARSVIQPVQKEDLLANRPGRLASAWAGAVQGALYLESKHDCRLSGVLPLFGDLGQRREALVKQIRPHLQDEAERFLSGIEIALKIVFRRIFGEGKDEDIQESKALEDQVKETMEELLQTPFETMRKHFRKVKTVVSVGEGRKRVNKEVVKEIRPRINYREGELRPLELQTASHWNNAMDKAVLSHVPALGSKEMPFSSAKSADENYRRFAMNAYRVNTPMVAIVSRRRAAIRMQVHDQRKAGGQERQFAAVARADAPPTPEEWRRAAEQIIDPQGQDELDLAIRDILKEERNVTDIPTDELVGKIVAYVFRI